MNEDAKFDELVKSHSHTKITKDSKKNLNIFNRPFFVTLCLRGEKLTFYEAVKLDGPVKSRLTVFIKNTDTVSKYLYLKVVLGKKA